MRRQTIVVDSRSRDVANYPDPGTYVAQLSETIRDVVAVELVFAVYEKCGTETYVSLFIDEFQCRAVSNSQTLCDAFTQLPLVSYLNHYSGGTAHHASEVRFPAPLEKLSRLTVRFQGGDGRAYKMLDHVMRFEVLTRDGTARLPRGVAQRPRYTRPEVDAAFEEKRLAMLSAGASEAQLQRLQAKYAKLLRAAGE